MALPLSPEVLAAITSGNVASSWLVNLHTDEGILRGWDQPFDVNFDGNIYEGLADAFRIEGEIRLGYDLVPESLTLVFEGSSQNDNASFMGRLVDRSWHQRRIELIHLLFEPGTNFVTQLGVLFEWTGTIDTIEAADAENAESDIVLSAEGGVFRALDLNLTTCTDLDQRLRDPNDSILENVAFKPQQEFPFGLSWSKVPGAVSGRGGFGGGGQVSFNNVIRGRF